MTETTAEKTHHYKFKAEISQLLDILTHSLYTHRDVFIRELVSNSADALDKVRFRDVKGESFCNPELGLEIRIRTDKDKRTFRISDTGVGMTRDELVQNIGTIAKSGTAEFVKKMAEQPSAGINLIGRFGVGFYSVFMAGERVEIVSKPADEQDAACIWTSDGRGTFEISDAKGKIKRGTEITVHLREDAQEFTDPETVRSAIQKYSNFVPFPIFVNEERVNKISAIWRDPKATIKDDQYQAFFKFIAHQEEDALTWMHLAADVPIQFYSLIFVPKTNFESLGFGRDEEGIHLFVKRVLVDAHARELLPPYLRFCRGVLESDDLPLNISRETLQENPFLAKIRNTVVSKFLGHLHELGQEKPEDYLALWKQHGRILKEGYNDLGHKDELAGLFRFNSSKCADADELVSLDTYVGRMHAKQEQVYFLSGPSRQALEANPAMEIFKAKDIEVLYCYDPIDEFVLPGLITFKDKMLMSIDQVDPAKLNDIPTRMREDKTAPPLDRKDADKLARRMKDILGNRVESVRLSERLVESPAVLVSANRALSGQMEKIMHMFNQEIRVTPKILEINPDHILIGDMAAIYRKDAKDPLLTKLVEALFTSVLLLDGTIDNPQILSRHIQDLISEFAKTARPPDAESGKSGRPA
jgi:molecular chaperone HtpG